MTNKGYTIISGGRYKRKNHHRCPLPKAFGRFSLEIHTVIQCNECGTKYSKEYTPDLSFMDTYWERVTDEHSS